MIWMKKKIKAFKDSVRLNFRYACRRVGIPGFDIHQIYLPEYDLIYIPIPKNACSTIKHSLYEIEFDREFDYAYQAKWGNYDIHDYYKKRQDSFTDVHSLEEQNKITSFAVIRDPVRRLISCYRNRVIDLGNLHTSAEELKKRGLTVKPDLNTFVLNLNEYCESNAVVKHHARSQASFLGNTLEILDRIFPISKMDKVESMLQQHSPQLQMSNKKSGGTPIGLEDLSREALEFAYDYYREDYKLLSDYYSYERLLSDYKNANN